MKLGWRPLAIYVAVMGLEGCVLYTWLEVVDQPVSGGQLVLGQFLLTYISGWIFNRVALWRRWPSIASFALNIVLWAAATLLMLKSQLYASAAFNDPAWLLAIPRSLANLLFAFEPPLLLLLGGTLAWWLGCRLARTRVSFAVALAEFQFGLAGILIMFFAATAAEIQMNNPVLLTVAFFAFGLTGISLAHAEEDAGSGGLHANWPWLLASAITIVVILGLAISWVVTPGILETILAAIGWVLQQVWNLFVFLISLLPEPGPVEPLPGSNITGFEPQERTFTFGLPEAWLNGLRIGWNILFIGLILVALWRISSQILAWMRRRMGNSGGEVESMPGAFRADFFGFLKRLFLRLLGLRWTRRPATTGLPEIASIRQLYRQMLRWASQYGWRRPDFQTPYEYLPMLEKMLPACAGDFRNITRYYVNARYGGVSPSVEEMQRLKASWHQINRFQPAPMETEAAK